MLAPNAVMVEVHMKLPAVLLLLLLGTPSWAASFCPWKVPGEARTERYINLTVVQYVEVGDESVRIAFGGGNLGSGHDVVLLVKNRDEGRQLLANLEAAARRCDGVLK